MYSHLHVKKCVKCIGRISRASNLVLLTCLLSYDDGKNRSNIQKTKGRTAELQAATVGGQENIHAAGYLAENFT
jgi:hypothetical protein